MGQEPLVAERLMHATVATTAATFLLFVSMETVVWFPKYCTFLKTGSTVPCFSETANAFHFSHVHGSSSKTVKKHKRLFAYCQLVAWPYNYSL